MKWDDIAKRLPGRSSISCRLRYQNYLEKRAVWDEEKKNKLARLYARYVNCKLLLWSIHVAALLVFIASIWSHDIPSTKYLYCSYQRCRRYQIICTRLRSTVLLHRWVNANRLS
jgi:hypothetical protein